MLIMCAGRKISDRYVIYFKPYELMLYFSSFFFWCRFYVHHDNTSCLSKCISWVPVFVNVATHFVFQYNTLRDICYLLSFSTYFFLRCYRKYFIRCIWDLLPTHDTKKQSLHASLLTDLFNRNLVPEWPNNSLPWHLLDFENAVRRSRCKIKWPDGICPERVRAVCSGAGRVQLKQCWRS